MVLYITYEILCTVSEHIIGISKKKKQFCYVLSTLPIFYIAIVKSKAKLIGIIFKIEKEYYLSPYWKEKLRKKAKYILKIKRPRLGAKTLQEAI